MTNINAYAAMDAGLVLEPYSYDPGELGANQVEIEVIACGICHSDLSVMQNHWRNAQYPLVPGHEAVGKIAALGTNISHLKVGQMVGVGWMAESCLYCGQCTSGHHHRCENGNATIVGRHGSFADRVRVDGIWAIPLPDEMDPKSAGPLFCGGITVFSPFIDFDIKPTDKVAVVGIGGLGHLALQFANKWGCEVTALTSSPDKNAELRELGAHKVINSRDEEALKTLRGQFNLVLSTVNVSLPWGKYLSALAPKGRLITVGIIGEPMSVSSGALVTGQKTVAGSDTGTPYMMARMLKFCARHDIKPMVNYFPMDKVNDAIKHLKDGKARYRVVLTR